MLLILSLIGPWAFAFDCAESDDDRNAYAQTRKLRCTIAEIAATINDGKEAVPKYIYHFGRKVHMDENVAHRNIPQKAWDDFIMGDKTRFQLAENRRGLYGTAGIDRNGFGGPEFNWLIQVEIKDECRKPENVVTYRDLPKNPRFMNWLIGKPLGERKFANWEDFNEKCIQNTASNISFTGNGPLPECAETLSAYLNETKVKVVQDHVIDRAFYIRDRNCIQTIKGSPKEIIEIAAKNDLLWFAQCGSHHSLNQFLKILLRSLAEMDKKVPDHVLNQLKKNMQTAGQNPEPILAYQRCADKNNLKLLTQDLENYPFEIPRLSERCY